MEFALLLLFTLHVLQAAMESKFVADDAETQIYAPHVAGGFALTAPCVALTLLGLMYSAWAPERAGPVVFCRLAISAVRAGLLCGM